MINTLCTEAHENAVAKGFYDKIKVSKETEELGFKAQLMEITGEVAEVLEAYKKNPTKVPEELADVAIRLFDFCGWQGVDLAGEINKKMAKNLTRGYLHGNIR